MPVVIINQIHLNLPSFSDKKHLFLRLLSSLSSFFIARELFYLATFSFIRVKFKVFEVVKENKHLKQRCPTFLSPGTGFVEDSFSTDGGWGGWFRR